MLLGRCIGVRRSVAALYDACSPTALPGCSKPTLCQRLGLETILNYVYVVPGRADLSQANVTTAAAAAGQRVANPTGSSLAWLLNRVCMCAVTAARTRSST